VARDIARSRRKERRMRIILVVGTAVVALGLVSGALADRPVHTKEEFSDELSVPAGALCDFEYHQAFTLSENLLVFGGGGRVTSHQKFTVAHTNADTDVTLTEKGIVTVQFSADDAREKNVGLFWHLRDASGKLVVVQAGQLLFDTETGELLKFTPNITPGFADVICPALGGAPAP
jgi:hypothetical protein